MVTDYEIAERVRTKRRYDMIAMLDKRSWRDSVTLPPIEERIARRVGPGVVTWCNPTETAELLGLLYEARAEILRLKGDA